MELREAVTEAAKALSAPRGMSNEVCSYAHIFGTDYDLLGSPGHYTLMDSKPPHDLAMGLFADVDHIATTLEKRKA